MTNTSNSHFIDQTNKNSLRLILFGLSVLIIISLGIVAGLQIYDGNYREAVVTAVGMLPILVGLGSIYYGNTEIAGNLIASSLIFLITILATLGQGIYDIGTTAFPAILIIASLVLKRKNVLYLTGLTILCIGWLVFGAIHGLYQPIYPDQTYFRQFIITSLILAVTTIAVYILSNTIRDSLQRGQKELQERLKAEQALTEAETMYRALVEQTTVVIYRDAPISDGPTNYISPQIEELLGYSLTEWKNNPLIWKELTHPDDLPFILAEIKNYLASGRKSVTEYRMRAKNGQWVWFQDEAVVIKDDNGTPLYVHGVLIDITERKNAEQKIRQREDIIGAVTETIQLLLRATSWRSEVNTILKLLGEATGANHVYIFENHLARDGVMLSSQKYEWVSPGMKSELANPAYQNTQLTPIPDIEDWHKNLSNGKPFYGSGKQYPRYWGRVFSISGLKTLLDVPIYVNEKWWGVIGFDDFINEMPWSQVEINALVAAAGSLGTAIERQASYDELRASEEKFNLAFQHTHVAMAISKASNHILLDVNNAFHTITGYSQEESIGKRAGQDLDLWIDQEDRNTILKSLKKRGFVDEYKARFRRKNGDFGVGLLSAVNISIDGEPCQLYAFVDISNIDHLLDELKAKNEELQSFTYTVSHDLKSPLVTISGFMGYLQQDARNGDIEKVNKDILRINEAVSKMQRLLNELLELSRIGRMMNPPEDVPFDEIVREALELVNGQLQANQIKVIVHADLPSVHVDRARLVQVIQNLLDNSAKFMKGQEDPRIEIGLDQIEGSTVFYVRDNGIGIEAEYFERVFGLFNKLDANSEGTGVGLALVKRIIEVHGGKIWVKSDGIGKGSTFSFTLANRPTLKVQDEE